MAPTDIFHEFPFFNSKYSDRTWSFRNSSPAWQELIKTCLKTSQFSWWSACGGVSTSALKESPGVNGNQDMSWYSWLSPCAPQSNHIFWLKSCTMEIHDLIQRLTPYCTRSLQLNWSWIFKSTSFLFLCYNTLCVWGGRCLQTKQWIKSCNQLLSDWFSLLSLAWDFIE